MLDATSLEILLVATTSTGIDRYTPRVRTREAGWWARLSLDGRLIVLLLAITLLGPYLPVLDWLGFPEFSEREVRLDNLLLPAVAGLVLLRSLAIGRIRMPLHVVGFTVFYAWLMLVTVLWLGKVPSEYGGTPSLGGLVQGGDAYIRPLLLLFIAANVRVTMHDFRVIIGLVLAVAVFLALVAIAQLTPGIRDYVNPFLAEYYDNSGSEQFFWSVLNQGRVSALMPQLSTLGMYMAVVVGILGAQFLGATVVRSRFLFAVLVGAALAGGILCGSKVFVGGLLLTVAMAAFLWFRSRHLNLATILSVAVAGLAVWIVVTAAFPEQGERFTGRIPSSGEGFYGQYLAPRFEPGTGKVYRSGAIDIASEYPMSGLGLNVVGRTTDSLLLGVVIMSGMVGGVLYVGTICVIGAGLLGVSRSHSDRYVAGLARMMLILTIVFFVAALGFHTFIQDRAGDAYWIIVGILLGPLAAGTRSAEPEHKQTRPAFNERVQDRAHAITEKGTEDSG